MENLQRPVGVLLQDWLQITYKQNNLIKRGRKVINNRKIQELNLVRSCREKDA